jgi:hypothetical protein
MRATLFDAKGHSLGIYQSREDAEDALRRRPDAAGGFVSPVPAVRSWVHAHGDTWGCERGEHQYDLGPGRSICVRCGKVVG